MLVGHRIGVDGQYLHSRAGGSRGRGHGGRCYSAGDVNVVYGGVAGEGAEIDAREFERAQGRIVGQHGAVDLGDDHGVGLGLGVVGDGDGDGGVAEAEVDLVAVGVLVGVGRLDLYLRADGRRVDGDGGR